MKYEVVALRFREMMRETGLTQQEVADRSGVGKSSISHYVNGTHCPNNITAFKIAKVFGCAPEWLMGFDVKSTRDLMDYVAEDAELQELVERFMAADEISKEMVWRILRK